VEPSGDIDGASVCKSFNSCGLFGGAVQQGRDLGGGGDSPGRGKILPML
jgi:hypothetical protein